MLTKQQHQKKKKKKNLVFYLYLEKWDSKISAVVTEVNSKIVAEKDKENVTI